MIAFIKKYREMILYMLCGIPTVVTNFGVYFIMANFNISTVICGIAAQLASIVVAYITNRMVVFQNKHHGKKAVFKEFIWFLSFRVLSGAIDVVALVVLVDKLGFAQHEFLIKVCATIFVIIFNYVASKCVIFKDE